MKDYTYYLKKVGDCHGHACRGIAYGTKISLAAMKALGLDPDVKNKNLIVYTETDRCMTDAVQFVTGCSLGHRSLKYKDYGRFAATFINTDTGQAVRGTIKKEFEGDFTIEELTELLTKATDEEAVNLQSVKVKIPEADLPGSPIRSAVCSVCGEKVTDARDITRNGKVLCPACANGRYYEEVQE